MANNLNNEWRYKHSKIIAKPAEGGKYLKAPAVDFGGQFEDDPRAVGNKLTPLQQKLIALSIARTTRR